MRKASGMSPGALIQIFSDQISCEDFDRYDLLELGKVKDDIKVDFDFENCEFSPYPEIGREQGIKRLYVTGGWFSFILAYAGGDWEHPVSFILYYDTNNVLRAYVPTDGNFWNYDTKCAIGNDEEKDLKFIMKWARNNNVGYDFDDKDCCNIADDFSYIINNKRAMAKDISKRIRVSI